jgi:sigma-B regulation protein RsbU (phosphoserine phosphatase)
MRMTRKPQLNGKKSTQVLETQLSLKELELTSLLEVTQAINFNLPENALYKIFHFTLIANLHIPKLGLFVLDKEWKCKVNYNTKFDYRTHILSESITDYHKISLLNNNAPGYEEFDIIIPIAHKTNVLAYVLVGGIQSPENYLHTSVIPFIQTFANIIIVAIENKKFARKELQQEALRKELEIAREVQSMLIPKELPHNSKVKMYATYLPHQSIGGDYYDYIYVDEDNYIVCIGDVSGKGVPAALLMSNFQACLRTLVRQTKDLKQIVHELNYSVVTNAKGERFITFFIAACNLKAKTITYINAGHNPSFLVSENGSVAMLEKGTTVLGAFTQLPFLEEDVLSFSKNSLLFCYTDGLTETSNEINEEFGIERIDSFLKANNQQNLKELHDSLKSNLDDFRKENDYADDITYLSCMLS